MRERLSKNIKTATGTINQIRENGIKRISHQRDFLLSGLDEADANDYVFYSDNDEIPKLENFKSKVLVKYSGLEPCIFNVRIRVTGDMWWHLNWNNGKPITSLNVKILNGHIKNITRFKLLLPQSRYGENEIFTSIFLKKAGFLSPRTFFVKAKVNGVSSNYIFQEDLRKEFLEYSLYREGPILEGDERFTISLKDSENIYENKTNLSRLVNKTYAKKNYLNSLTALYSVSNLNLLYLFNHNAEYPRNVKKK